MVINLLTLVHFTLTLFISGLLLGVLPQIIGKFILPTLGFTDGIGASFYAFFQVIGFLGYLYPHLLGMFPRSYQVLLQTLCLLFPFICLLPIPFNFATWLSEPETNPISTTLWDMILLVGFPCFAVATSASLLQKWFSFTNRPTNQDPYVLFTASNLGVVGGLLVYHLVMNPYFRVRDQAWLWTIGYAFLGLLTFGCAVLVWRTKGELSRREAERISARRRLKWVGLAAVPWCLPYLIVLADIPSAEVPALPFLLMVRPVLYLLSLALAFLGRPFFSGCFSTALSIGLISFVAVVVLFLGSHRLADFAAEELILFTTALVCHSLLAKDRPSVEHLTGFYLFMALGRLPALVLC